VCIISGPSVAIVKATPLLGEGAEVSPDGVLVRQRLRQQVRGRADLEHDCRVVEQAHQLGSARARMPWPIRSGEGARPLSADLLRAGLPSSPTWIVIPSPAARAVSTIGLICV
jgi:hypothetical protein